MAGYEATRMKEADMKRTTRKPRATKSMSDLPAKRLRGRAAKDVRGGGENVSFNYGTIKWKYSKQEAAGTEDKK
jgi:hypothetical protein